MKMGELHDQKVDVWAFGVLLYELAYRKSPFADSHAKGNKKQIFAQMEKIELSDEVNKAYNDLILKCLTLDQIKRPSFE